MWGIYPPDKFVRIVRHNNANIFRPIDLNVAKARSLQSCPANYQDSTVFISPACVSRGKPFLFTDTSTVYARIAAQHGASIAWLVFCFFSSDPTARTSHRPVSYTHLRAHETRHDLVC